MKNLTPVCVVDLKAQEVSVLAFRKEMLKLPRLDIETLHLIHGDMYARTVLVPAGCAATGVSKKVDNICIISGDISATTDEGVVRLTGYHVIAAKAGTSRAVFAHADTYWTTLVQTELKDVEEIEDFVTDESASLQTRVMKINNNPIKEIKE